MRVSGDLALLRWSLAFVWLATAATSLWELKGQSALLLSSAGITDTRLQGILVVGGAVVDALLGLALLARPLRTSYFAALAMMLVMTLVASALEPSLWLHPLGPLTKNLPIAAALWLLAQKCTEAKPESNLHAGQDPNPNPNKNTNPKSGSKP
ncbi:MAG: epimerase [Comamonadaceae bacterium]|nr:MAG: epimerase [Comamonadaceae bacterium]